MVLISKALRLIIHADKNVRSVPLHGQHLPYRPPEAEDAGPPVHLEFPGMLEQFCLSLPVYPLPI